MRFIALSLSLLLFSCSSDPIRQDTEFIAYTISQFTLFRLDSKDENYPTWMQQTFGITANEFDQVMEYVQEFTSRDELQDQVDQKIWEYAHAWKSNPDSVQQFVYKVLSPFIWRIRTGSAIDEDTKELVLRLYENVLGTHESGNGLLSLMHSFQNYKKGGYYSNDSLSRLNEALKPHGFYLKFDPDSKYTCIFSIDRKWIDTSTSALQPLQVYFLKRTIPCALPSENGYSSVGAQDVVVFVDKAEVNAKEIVTNFKDSAYLHYAHGEIQEMWDSAGLQLNLTQANLVFNRMDSMEISTKNVEQLALDLTYEVAIHEAKHKFDEYRLERRINWDSEVSAHLTQCLYSPNPLHALGMAIRRLEGFTMDEWDPKILTTINKLWKIAEGTTNGSLSQEQMLSQVRQVYQGYTTYFDSALPELTEFESKIVGPLSSVWNLGLH